MTVSPAPTRLTRQASAPYADAIRSLAAQDWQRLHVPAHQGDPRNAPGLERIVGEAGVRMDFPVLFSGIDQSTWRLASDARATPLAIAQDLAAEVWGASRAWFLGNGASSGNHIATMVARGLGREAVVQRSVHSSVVDGMIHVGLEPRFVQPVVDVGLGTAHGVTADQVEHELRRHPDSAAVYLVSPSYFGAVSDVAAIAETAHAFGVPLIVDEAWGSHFGLHPELPVNAVRLGADLVVSSTHKGAGSLTQSAMMFLGHGPQARRIEWLVDRVHRSFQSTSTSALLLGSLDEARRHVATEGERVIGETLAAAAAIREGVRTGGRFRDATEDVRRSPGTVGHDPLKIVIDTRPGGLSGGEAQHLLLRDHRIYVELATPSVIVLLLGATSRIDAGRFLAALHALPEAPGSLQEIRRLPSSGERRMGLREAFFAPTETVPAHRAEGRVSADSLAAYPPGIPNVLPGEELTGEVIGYLRATAASPSGYVRGALDARLDELRVVAETPDSPSRK